MNRKPSVKVSVSGLEMVHPCIRSESFSTQLGPSTRTPQTSCGVRISKGKLRLGFQTQLLGNLTGGRIAQERTVRKKDDGQRRDIISRCGEKLFRSLVCLDVQPLVRHKVASKEIAYLTRLRRPLMPDDAHALK